MPQELSGMGAEERPSGAPTPADVASRAASAPPSGPAGVEQVAPTPVADVLAGLDDLPLEEHVTRFAALHETLNARLADGPGDDGPGDVGPSDGGHA
ncbi:hypothetical protein ET495_02895 [Xylanimonas allomyrinae]|uniref:Uncharacterized protein n=1 Tax=Xylanimonas allomyrinae TaxID=2509459 RepID=A0A4P6EJ76_9MICO|nr:hypothetical protein [Xylanimonas allomyrinae]QAY62375.1 hypothetical protein ET495_02895 [Xylanimonas allomyrinae]